MKYGKETKARTRKTQTVAEKLRHGTKRKTKCTSSLIQHLWSSDLMHRGPRTMNHPHDTFGSFHDVLNNDFCDMHAFLKHLKKQTVTTQIPRWLAQTTHRACCGRGARRKQYHKVPITNAIRTWSCQRVAKHVRRKLICQVLSCRAP